MTEKQEVRDRRPPQRTTVLMLNIFRRTIRCTPTSPSTTGLHSIAGQRKRRRCRYRLAEQGGCSGYWLIEFISAADSDAAVLKDRRAEEDGRARRIWLDDVFG